MREVELSKQIDSIQEKNKDLISRTVTILLLERQKEKIVKINEEKQQLQREMNIVSALFEKVNQRDSDLVDTILEYHGIDPLTVESIKLSDDKTNIIVIKKPEELKLEYKKVE